MESDVLLGFLSHNGLPLILAVTALVVTLLVAITVFRMKSRTTAHHDILKERVDALWRDRDELRVNQFNGYSDNKNKPGAVSPGNTSTAEQFATEKAAYEDVWPQVWSLHDKLGMFLRSVESGEPTGELRVEARNAALEARSTLNRVRPFCHDEVDDLVTQLIDTDIKAHLAACQYMDLLKGGASANPNHDRTVQREKFRMLYDGEARELMSQLVATIRSRTIKRG